MTAHPKDGGPAFPVHDLQAAQPRSTNDLGAMARGMSLRDYFAGQALCGFIASLRPDVEPTEIRSGMSLSCYEIADAMLKAREVQS